MDKEKHQEIKKSFTNLKSTQEINIFRVLDSQSNPLSEPTLKASKKILDILCSTKDDLNLTYINLKIKKEGKKAKKQKEREKEKEKAKKEKKEEDDSESEEEETNKINPENKIKEKYRNYLPIFKTEVEGINSNNLLYIFSRLVGGICSIETEYRDGYCFTLMQILKKFDDIIDYNEMIQTIKKESFFKKSESSTSKNILSSGRLLLFSCILSASKLVSGEVLYDIFSNILSTLESNYSAQSEETAIKTIQCFIDSLFKGQFECLNNSKKSHKTIESIFSILFDFSKLSIIKQDKVFKPEKSKSKGKNKDFRNKNNHNQETFKSRSINTLLFQSSVILLLNKVVKSDVSSKSSNSTLQGVYNYLSNFLKQNPKYSVDNKTFTEIQAEESSFYFVMKELLSKSGKNHVYLEILEDFLKTTIRNKEPKYIAYVWNCMTTQENVMKFMEISNKNYQFFLSKLSQIVIEALGESKFKAKIFEIFDINFFVNFLKFEGGKTKHKCLSQILSVLHEVLASMKAEEKEIKDYCSRIIRLFDGKGFSTLTFKPFFVYLFEKIGEEKRAEYVNFLISTQKVGNGINNKMEVDEEEEEEDEDELMEENYGNDESRKVFYSKINALKTIITVSLFVFYLSSFFIFFSPKNFLLKT